MVEGTARETPTEKIPMRMAGSAPRRSRPASARSSSRTDIRPPMPPIASMKSGCSTVPSRPTW
jgi:hypothetical protein